MISKVTSVTCIGIHAYIVTIEVDGVLGLPSINIVGLPDQSIRESKERIRSALHQSGFKLAGKRFTVNLAPADIKKEGPGFDVPIALGILGHLGHVSSAQLSRYVFLGELSLDGVIRPVHGVLSMVIGMREHTVTCVVPNENLKEALLQSEVPVVGVGSLKELVDALQHDVLRPVSHRVTQRVQEHAYAVSLEDVKGHHAAKRALEVAVSGGHNLLMVGPPGSGKTLLARTIPSLLPEPSEAELLDIIRIYSTREKISARHFVRPFRSPHHTISAPAMAGSGSDPKPGEISLAHNGVLFLDEFPEYPRSVLETLRGPLEDHMVTIARSKETVTYPARFMLVCAMNPCPCGYLSDPERVCQCKYESVVRYQTKVSGPIGDRIDIHIEVPRLRNHELKEKHGAESSRDVRKRIDRVRAVQMKRYARHGFFTNAALPPKLIEKYCVMTGEAETLLDMAMTEYQLSARAYHRLLKLSRTIADMDMVSDPAPGASSRSWIQAAHMAEAVQYRGREVEK